MHFWPSIGVCTHQNMDLMSIKFGPKKFNIFFSSISNFALNYKVRNRSKMLTRIGQTRAALIWVKFITQNGRIQYYCYNKTKCPPMEYINRVEYATNVKFWFQHFHRSTANCRAADCKKSTIAIQWWQLFQKVSSIGIQSGFYRFLNCWIRDCDLFYWKKVCIALGNLRRWLITSIPFRAI